uniref:Uncharacterized protein n=1 Tax=Romanomermis culicivorax TaxID=13658 RepID=A0A915L3I0_ROMCU
MATSGIVETNSSFGQPQDRQDNMSFLISNYILSCCVYDLEIMLAQMKDKPRAGIVGISPEALSLEALMIELYAHDTMEPELVADLARRFRETFEDKYTDQQGKGAYEVEAIVTYKLAEEQAPGTFYCPPHFSKTDIEPQLVPCSWYIWIERKVKAQEKRKSTDEDDEPTND